ncbi:hypothetical protein KCU65_g242, partial [Aureobasidium melanogenum]
MTSLLPSAAGLSKLSNQWNHCSIAVNPAASGSVRPSLPNFRETTAKTAEDENSRSILTFQTRPMKMLVSPRSIAPWFVRDSTACCDIQQPKDSTHLCLIIDKPVGCQAN